MPTRNVVLTEHQANLVEQLVAAGRYQNASEVLRDGLRLVETREAENQARLRAMRAAVHVGVDDFNAGRFREFRSASKLKTALASSTKAVLTGRRRVRR